MFLVGVIGHCLPTILCSSKYMIDDTKMNMILHSSYTTPDI